MIDNNKALTIVVDKPAIHEQATTNPAAVYLASLSKGSRRTMTQALSTIAEMAGFTVGDMPWHNLRNKETQAIRARLAEQYKPATANKMLSALRGVLNAACDLGAMTDDECRAACKFKPVKGESLVKGREVEYEEIKSLVKVCKKDKSAALGARDAAIIGLMWSAGLRRGEVVALDLSDYNATTGELIVRSGKGSKARKVYTANGSQTALDAWITVRGTEPGPLFLEVHRGGHIQKGKHLKDQTIYDMLKRRAEQAGVEKFSPHDLRRTFISELLDRGADIVTVQKLAGHASPTTTGRYDRRGEETKRKAASLLHFPF